jgi:hypothetical protein
MQKRAALAAEVHRLYLREAKAAFEEAAFVHA